MLRGGPWAQGMRGTCAPVGGTPSHKVSRALKGLTPSRIHFSLGCWLPWWPQRPSLVLVSCSNYNRTPGFFFFFFCEA